MMSRKSIDSAPRSPCKVAEGLTSDSSTPSACTSTFVTLASMSFEAGKVWSFLDKLRLQTLERLQCIGPRDLEAIIVAAAWDQGCPTGHASALQMPRAYSPIVRSLENVPECPTLTIARRAQAS